MHYAGQQAEMLETLDDTHADFRTLMEITDFHFALKFTLGKLDL